MFVVFEDVRAGVYRRSAGSVGAPQARGGESQQAVQHGMRVEGLLEVKGKQEMMEEMSHARRHTHTHSLLLFIKDKPWL